jgi:hypothetical protein
MEDAKIPRPFKIEELCSLPFNLARTELVVRPVVAFLHADEPPDKEPSPLVEETMIPRLDAKEVAAVFSAPFRNFLKASDQEPAEAGQPLPEGHWYDGSWISWKDQPWRVHNFYVPVNNQRVSMPENRGDDEAGVQGKVADRLEKEGQVAGRFKVWGVTARILVDAARIAYGKEPEFEHNSHYGDEKLIMMAEKEGSLGDSKM